MPGSSLPGSWNDASPRPGLYTLCQPTIWPLFQTRQAQDSLLRWTGNTDDYYTYIKKYWEKNLYPAQSMYSDFQTFWDMCVKEGALEATSSAANPSSTTTSGLDVTAAATAVSSSAGNAKGLELTLYEKVPMGAGEYANKPWPPEMPDPIDKVVWDNYVCVSPKFATDNKYEMDIVTHKTDVVKLTVGKMSMELP